jgi:hypothetical protein
MGVEFRDDSGAQVNREGEGLTVEEELGPGSTV